MAVPPDPVSVWPVVTYVPAFTQIVDPADAAFNPSWIVLKAFSSLKPFPEPEAEAST